jgi:hypothetical protein
MIDDSVLSLLSWQGGRAGMLTSPESPTHLLQKGDYAAAEAAGEKLWGHAYKGELFGAGGLVRDAGKMQARGDYEATGEATKDAGKRFGQTLKQGGHRNTEAEGASLALPGLSCVPGSTAHVSPWSAAPAAGCALHMCLCPAQFHAA